ncbi:MAG: 16S rRNA (adenine(1518)-N(6)/adenine(1519)-N(6))-dimethyltransferase RsmA [Bacilli bacterium]|nr:16S rRNA (adenine(1518)-N(6)/adenine(1519)-N(6))-dimethyltransferase RsmA [Bacilli bacterium]MDD4282224.1 16S rRNA (adenine(1518)-N(6)/adenine(1519)-N(6))-dimethyltransferase RsmA [Bacilli bacterium]MDD4718223.1 16S rRNA (adenine(1518)-N(6)/adenine(1519)-N(6))-dimethyltransferase RsmA [Bacilli bacterium]
MNYSPKKMQEMLNKYNFSFKKKFGQNFIVDENVINTIIKKSNIDKETLVIEIGPGSGALTNKLALHAKSVICYEIDIKLKEIIDNNLKNYNNVKIIYEDFLKSNVLNDIKDYKYKQLYVVANLPYYITTPIIVKLIEDNIDVDKIVVMVQKEVGDRFRAKPGSRDYNSLSIFLNYYYDVKKIMDISKNVFIPKPNVDSIVVEFNKKKNNLSLKSKEFFFKLIKDSFRQKRKTIRNNLREYDLDKVEKILLQNNLNLSSRAEHISIEVFVEMANYLVK